VPARTALQLFWDNRLMRVGLFVTCLVDLMRPSIGFAAIRLLEAAGCDVVVPQSQTCCGQPGYNSGDRTTAQALARKLLDEFEDCEYIVAPSGSCAGMVRTHYPELFADEPAQLERVQRLCTRTYELCDFLMNVARLESIKETATAGAVGSTRPSMHRTTSSRGRPHRRFLAVRIGPQRVPL
jgi:L-lactate dehydrogenase complex protein LldE